MKMLLAGVAAAALAACSGGADDDAQNVTIDTGMNTSGDDVATDNLTLDSSASNVDQAINATDQQSGVPQAADNAADTVENRTP